ncbi:MAG: tetratricopeptide repeat protein [Candidatus Aureabacteria bacterium]|nr:tetratricopeptide repeat protein [Candidatus Auribacterota bacterium]
MMRVAIPLFRCARKARQRAVASTVSLALIAAAVVLVPGCGSRDTAKAKAHKGVLRHYRLGANKYREGDFEAAISIYEKVLQLDPNLAPAHLDLGIIYDDYRSDKANAILHYKEYLRLEPQSEKADMVARWIHSAEEEKSTGTVARPVSGPNLQGGAGEGTEIQADLQRARQDIANLRTENDAYLKTVEALREELSGTKQQMGALLASAAQGQQGGKGRTGVKADEAKSALNSLTRSLESEKAQLWEKYLNEKGQFDKTLEALKAEIANLQAQKKASDEALKKSNERFEALKKVASEEKGPQPTDESLRQKSALANEKVAELQRESAFYLKDNKTLLSRIKKAEKELDEYRAKQGPVLGAQPQLSPDAARLLSRVRADGEKEKEGLRQLYEKKFAELTSASAREKAELQSALAEAQPPSDSEKLIARVKADMEKEKEELRLRYEKRLAELSGSLGREKTGVQRELADARREALFFKAQADKEKEKAGRSEKVQADALLRLNEQRRREKAELEQRFRQEKDMLLGKLVAAQGRTSAEAPTLPQPRSPVREKVQSAPQKGAEPRTQNPPAAAAVRRYQVARGDSLRSLALRFYGSADRWRTIYDANRGILSGPNAPLRPGKILVIP